MAVLKAIGVTLGTLLADGGVLVASVLIALAFGAGILQTIAIALIAVIVTSIVLVNLAYPTEKKDNTGS